MTDMAYSEWEDHLLIRGSKIDQDTKVSDTKVSLGVIFFIIFNAGIR